MAAADRERGQDTAAPPGAAAPVRAAVDEADLVDALRRGDEGAFAELVDRHGASMLRVARLYVGSGAVAEEVVQETWLALIQGIDRFEGRSSLKTWLFTVLANRARTRGSREGRSVPFSALAAADAASGEPAVDPDRFNARDAATAPYGWAAPPRAWPEERLLARETLDRVGAAIAALPESQRAVVSLRDVEGWSADEVCAALGVSEGNQRVLLHRGRSKVRTALERYLDQEQGP